METTAGSVMNLLWRRAPGKSEEQATELRTGQSTDRKMPQDGLVTVCSVTLEALLHTSAMARSDL